MTKAIEGKPTAPVVVSDLREIENLCSEPFEVVVVIRGRPFKFTGRRLVPAESARVQLLLESALPPLLGPAEGDTEPRYDYRDMDYMRRKEEGKRKARALALWLAYPYFKERARADATVPTVDNVEKITEFVENLKVDDDVLEALYRPVIHGIVGADAYLGFISGSGSPKS